MLIKLGLRFIISFDHSITSLQVATLRDYAD